MPERDLGGRLDFTGRLWRSADEETTPLAIEPAAQESAWMVDSLAVPSAEAAALRRRPLGIGFKAIYGAGNTADAVVSAMLGTWPPRAGSTCTSPRRLRNLGLICGLGVAAIYATATVVFMGYRLDRVAYATVQQILDARRAAAADAA